MTNLAQSASFIKDKHRFFVKVNDVNSAIKYYLLGIRYKRGHSAYNLGRIYSNQLARYNSKLAIKYYLIAIELNVDADTDVDVNAVIDILYYDGMNVPIKIYNMFLTIKKTNSVRKKIKTLKSKKEVKNEIALRKKCYTNKQKYMTLNYDVNKRFINYLGSNKLA